MLLDFKLSIRSEMKRALFIIFFFPLLFFSSFFNIALPFSVYAQGTQGQKEQENQTQKQEKQMKEERREKCILAGTQCLVSGERVIDGEKVVRECWEKQEQYDCFTDEVVKDYCQGIASTPGCFLKTSACLEKDPEGGCHREERVYFCSSPLGGKDSDLNTERLNTEYTVTRDELETKECDPYELSENCEVVDEVCVEPAETRNINGKEVFKECWKFEKKYVCKTGSFISDCDRFDARVGLKKGGCELIGETCLSAQDDVSHDDSYLGQAVKWVKGKIRTGECYHKEKKYRCEGQKSLEELDDVKGVKGVEEVEEGKEDKKTVFRCGSVEYCIEGRDENGKIVKACDEMTRKKNTSLGKAVTYLHVLKQMKEELGDQFCQPDNTGSCKLFSGDRQKCKKDPLGARNCCDHDEGWLEKMGFLGCGESEKMLGKQCEKGLCHYVGSHCSKKTPKPFSVCLEKKQSYCCFKSKLSRIIQEQGRSQLGMGWGDAEDPDCRALTLEEFKRLDFSKLDLKEVIGEIEAKVTRRVLNLQDRKESEARKEIGLSLGGLKEKAKEKAQEKAKKKDKKEIVEEKK